MNVYKHFSCGGNMKKLGFTFLMLLIFSQTSNAYVQCRFNFYGVDASGNRLGINPYNQLLASLSNVVQGNNFESCIETAPVSDVVRKICASSYYKFRDFTSTQTNQVDKGIIKYWAGNSVYKVYPDYPYDCRYFR